MICAQYQVIRHNKPISTFQTIKVTCIAIIIIQFENRILQCATLAFLLSQYSNTVHLNESFNCDSCAVTQSPTNMTLITHIIELIFLWRLLCLILNSDWPFLSCYRLSHSVPTHTCFSRLSLITHCALLCFRDSDKLLLFTRRKICYCDLNLSYNLLILLIVLFYRNFVIYYIIAQTRNGYT